MDDEEEALVQRLVELQTAPPPAAAAANDAAAAAKQAWYADAFSFLQRHGSEHWWCRHGDVTAGGCWLASRGKGRRAAV